MPEDAFVSEGDRRWSPRCALVARYLKLSKERAKSCPMTAKQQFYLWRRGFRPAPAGARICAMTSGRAN